MSTIHVCPLHLVPDEARRLLPSALVTLLSPSGAMPERPGHLEPGRHLTRLFHDISTESEGLQAPRAEDVAAVIAFGRAWDRRSPILIHCFAGISRSTAAAYIIAADLHPSVLESVLAQRLRAASPSATPNMLMIKHADQQLGREGRMITAIADIGMGEFSSHGRAFTLPLG